MLWSSVLFKAMHLPFGLYETVMEYLPLPRVWKWSLSRIERRIKWDPQQAMLDLSCVMDEILRDANVISGVDQTQMGGLRATTATSRQMLATTRDLLHWYIDDE
eukprot:gene28371-35213_t